MGGKLLLLTVAFAVLANFCYAEPVGTCPDENEVYVTFLTDSEDCRIFYKCSWGVPYEYVCPANLYFNTELNVCDHPEQTDCGIPSGGSGSTEEGGGNVDGGDGGGGNGNGGNGDGGNGEGDNGDGGNSGEGNGDGGDGDENGNGDGDGESAENGGNGGGEGEDNGGGVVGECPSDNSGEAVHLPHESDCTLFYKCDWGVPVLQECPGGLHFNPRLEVCDWPKDAGCNSGSGGNGDGGDGGGGNGNGGDGEGDNGNGNNSGEGNGDGGDGDENGNGDGDGESGENGGNGGGEGEDNGGGAVGECPADNSGDAVHLPHESDCTLFYKCDRGVPVLHECPGGLHFNPRLEVCDWPKDAGCDSGSGGNGDGGDGGGGNGDGGDGEGDNGDGNNSGEGNGGGGDGDENGNGDRDGESAENGGNGGGEGEDNGGGAVGECPADNSGDAVHLPHESDCTLFYKCDWGVPVLQECPDGLHFNPSLEVCDLPEDAGCDSGSGGNGDGGDGGLQCSGKNPPLSCSCPSGYEYKCVDIDECTKHNPCDPLTKCLNTDPGFACTACPPGYLNNLTGIYFWQYNPQEPHKCYDIDECAQDIDNCAATAACNNLRGSFECIQCDPNAESVKTLAQTEKCECNVGWAGDGTVCGKDSDIDGWPDQDLSCTVPQCKKDNCVLIPNSGQEDADGDGVGDACDTDSDNDGILNTQDNCPTISNTDQRDSDGDGVGDACDNCIDISNKGQQDFDGDKLGDECDPDIDGDGLENAKDNCRSKPNSDQLDTDEDGIGDVCDNCPKQYNPGQEDKDENLIGDACDVGPDTDGDGVVDVLDNCIEIPNADQLDSDKDGIGDACDDDIDNDGYLNIYDNCVFISNPDQKDSDGDGRGDACADDNDGDGISDALDNCPNNSLIHRTDFRYFQTIKLDPSGTPPLDPNWVIYNYGAEITQTENSDPGLAVDFNKIGGLDYDGTFFVEDTSDDDFAGFIFSYQSNRKFYVISWKKNYQKWKNSYGEPGVQINLVNSATGPGEMLGKALWHTGTTTNQVKLLYHDPKKVGWQPGKSYRWKLIHRPIIGLIRLRMYDGPTLVTDSGNIFDKTLTGGRVGVYCNSQEDIIWSNVQYNCNDLVPKDIYAELPAEYQELVGSEP